MKKALLGSLMVVLVALFWLPTAVNAYTINDTVPDGIGVRTFEAYGIDVYNFTPGVNSGAIYFDLFTNYPENGLLVGSWDTQPADLFITEKYQGVDYKWAIPLVSRTGFNAGTMYAVGSYLVSDDLAPDGGGYIYNHNVPVQIASIGSNYGYTAFVGGTVTWNDITPPGSPDWSIHVTTNIFEDDANGQFSLLWGTATCANDIISGSTAPVPEPATMLLLGSGLVGLAGWGRKKLFKRA